MSGERIIVGRGALTAIVVAIFVAIGLAGAAGVLALVLLGDAQDNRVTSNVTICTRLNDVSLGLRGFVHEVSPRLDPKARARFKVEPDCDAYARRAVKP